MKYSFGYGYEPKDVEIPEKNIIKILKPNSINYKVNEGEELLRAIRNPIGTKSLSEIINKGESVAIITSDITRPLPSYKILPVLIDELYSLGIDKNDITIVFALGSHRKHTDNEIKELVGDRIFKEIKCIDGDSKDIINLGTTVSGTPVDITRVVADADRKICLGNIEYHYFAGYSGGAKAIMPGVSTREAIQANHSKMVSPNARAGNVKDNPVRIDLEEAIEFCPIDFIINVVLDEKKQIIKAVAGHFIEAHREGCKFLDSIYKIDIEEKADIVIVSQGGYPKDLNLYQTQKALDNSKHAIRDGGIIILVGACNEGMGEEVFEDWMVNAKDPKELIERIQIDFKLGGHKAAAIALVLEKARIYFVSEFDDDFIKSIFMEPYQCIQEAIDNAFNVLGRESKVILMPYGGSTLPNMVEK